MLFTDLSECGWKQILSKLTADWQQEQMSSIQRNWFHTWNAMAVLWHILFTSLPHSDSTNKRMDILPEAVNWATLYAEVNRNYESRPTVKVVFMTPDRTSEISYRLLFYMVHITWFNQMNTISIPINVK